MPTTIPSRTPSQAPSTTVPSALSTIDGAVVSITASSPVTENLSSAYLSDLVSTIADKYDVEDEIRAPIGHFGEQWETVVGMKAFD